MPYSSYIVGVVFLVCFTFYWVDLNPPPETYTITFEDDCYIRHDGNEMKLISVDDLKEKLK